MGANGGTCKYIVHLLCLLWFMLSSVSFSDASYLISDSDILHGKMLNTEVY